MLEFLEPDTRSDRPVDLWTRQDLFGEAPSAAEKGFQQRCLVRLCKLGVLDSLWGGTARMRFYALRDSVQALDALTDDEVLTRLIWVRAGAADFVSEPETGHASGSPEVVSPAGSAEEHGSVEGTLTAMADSDAGLQGTVLRLLAGLVETLYYVRVKVEGIDARITRMEAAYSTLVGSSAWRSQEPLTPSNGVQGSK
jgi:hypothetical protein